MVHCNISSSSVGTSQKTHPVVLETHKASVVDIDRAEIVDIDRAESVDLVYISKCLPTLQDFGGIRLGQRQGLEFKGSRHI